MGKLVKNYIYNVAYQIFLVVTPLVTAPYLTRVLSSESIGTYDYILSIINLIVSFGLIGLNTFGYRQIAYCRDDKIAMSKSFSDLLLLRVLLLFISTIVYLCIAFFSEETSFFLISYALLASYFVDVSWLFIGVENIKLPSIRNFLAKLITIIGIFVFIKSDLDLWLYFVIFSFSTLLTVLSCYPLLKKYIVFCKPSFKRSLSFVWPSLKLFLPSVATVVYLQCDKIMLKVLSNSATQVAYYNYAEKFINMPLGIITALSIVMLPRISYLFIKKEKKEIEFFLNKSLDFSMFLAIPMSIGLACISTSLIPWYLGEEYIFTAYAMIILSPLCIINSAIGVFAQQYFVPVNDTKILAISYVGAAIIDVVLNFLLIPSMGYAGAALATLVCLLYSSSILWLKIRKKINFAFFSQSLYKKLVAGLIMFVVVLTEVRLLPIAWYYTFVEIISGMLVYFLLAIVLNDTCIEMFKTFALRKRKQ